MPLDYVNSIPLHTQLRDIIQERIIKGKFIEKIPSERELMDEFHVSRSTVRQSIEQLVREGLLVRRPGKGTYVALKPISDWLGSLSSTNETITNMDMTPGTKLITAHIIELAPELRKITGLQQAYYFKRVRFANHVPIGVENHYYPIEIGEKLVSYDLNQEAFYDLLEKELDIKAFEADQTILSVDITKEDAELLHVSHNTHVLNAQRIISDVNGRFVEFENAYYRSDMYSFKIKLSRKNL